MLLRDSSNPAAATLVSRVVKMMINAASTHANVAQNRLATTPQSSQEQPDPQSSIRAHMAGSLPASLRIPVSLLPPGFQDVILASLLSSDVIKLVVSVNDTMEPEPDQAVAIWTRHMPQIQSSLSLSRSSHHPKFFDPWLCWAVLAHLFQHSPISHRQKHSSQIQKLVQHVIRSFASNADVKSVLGLIESEAISLNVGNFAVRDCAVWSLMSVAYASERCRKDNVSAEVTVGREIRIDEHAVTLMAKIRWMLRFDTQKVARDVDVEWGVLEEILMRFWSLNGLKKEWEVMYRKMLTY